MPPVPVVYLSGTRAAPFHPGEKHEEAETADSEFFFYIHVASLPLTLSSPFQPSSSLHLLFPLLLLPCANLYAWQDAFPGITLLITLPCVYVCARNYQPPRAVRANKCACV